MSLMIFSRMGINGRRKAAQNIVGNLRKEVMRPMIRLMKYLKPYWKSVLVILGLTLAGVFSELFLPRLMGNIVDIGITNGDLPYIYGTGLRMVVIALLGTISMVLSSYLSARAATAYGRDVRAAVFAKVEGFSMSEFNQMGTASLITRTTNDIHQVQQVIMMSLRMMARAPLMLVGGLVMAVTTNPALSKVLVIASPLLIITMAIVGYIGFPLFKQVQLKTDALNRVMRENLTGIRVIRAFNKIDFEVRRFDMANWELTDIFLKVARLMALVMPLVSAFLNFVVVAVIWYGSRLIDTGSLEVGQLMAFIQYVMMILFSLIMVSMIFIMIPRASASALRINEIFDQEAMVKDDEAPVTNKVKKGENRLEFRDVSFKYEGAENPVVCHLNFSVKQGETTAIIGGTGAGKSTIINLIMRFYDVSEGTILLNDTNIATLPQAQLRQYFGLVPQNTILFTGSIRDNIALGKEGASDEEISQALQIAQAADFVIEREEGLNHVLAQGGKNLSGGQKQRLSIARALVRRPAFYLFDDSFSALDFKTDRQLRQELKKVTADAGVLMVAQRIGTIIDADHIIVLEQGKIAGQGTHGELLRANQVYREIVSSQLGEEALA